FHFSLTNRKLNHRFNGRKWQTIPKRQVHSSGKFGRKKRDEVRLAQTSDRLSDSRTARDSDLFPGSGVSRTTSRRRQLDHTGFPRPHLLELRHVTRHPGYRKFYCHSCISKVRSVAHSLWLDRAFRHSAHQWRGRLRKTAGSRHLE